MPLTQDIRYALRTFARNPGLVAAVRLSIGLGVAANTTVFSMVNTLLLGQLPVRDANRLVAFDEGKSYSWPDYLDYREGTRPVFEDVAAHFPLLPASIGGRGEPERIWGQGTTGNYFSVIGVQPQFGRGFTAEQDKEEHADVVVLSHGLWKRRFGGDPNIIGQKVLLNNYPYEVLGVTPPGYHGTERGLVAEFWVPIVTAARLMPDLPIKDLIDKRTSQWVTLTARLKPGVSREQAQAAANVVKQRIDKTYRKDPQDHHRPPIRLTLAGGLPAGSNTPAMALMTVLMAVVALVLLIACANVANLMLARAASRQKEIGVRLAVGAGRMRLIRQLLTESVLLSIGGATFGFWLAWMATTAMSHFEPPIPLPIAFDFTPDMRVFLFTAVLAVLTGIVFGLVPALRATRPDLISVIKNDSAALGTTRRFGLRNGLVVVQVAFSLVLLIGSVLFLRSLQQATSIDIGMRADNVLLLAFDPKLHHYSRERTTQLIDELRNRVNVIPGVRSVSYVDSIPLSIGGTSFGMRSADAKANSEMASVDIYNVGIDYFKTMGIPVLRGREFNRADHGATAIINETLARRLFGKGDPLGRQVYSEEGPAGNKMYEVIGIARNTKSRTIGEDPQNIAYFFLENAPDQVMSFYGISIAVKTSVPPRQLEPSVRAELRKLDPNLPVFGIETMQEHVDKSMLLPRLCATLLGLFGAVGLSLATIGLYGVINFSVRARTREIGIRMALGAEAGRVVGMVMRQGIGLVLTGLVAGLAISFALTRFAASLLYGISTTDAVTFVVVPAVMVAVAIAAVLLPARRASRVDPLNALRYE